METIIFSTGDIRQIAQHIGINILMDEMIGRLTSAFKEHRPEKNTTPARAGFTYSQPNTGLLEWMPIMNGSYRATIKIVGYHPFNPKLRNLPTIISTISVYDTTSGHLMGLADGTFLTALRTGAASAIASRLMASPEAKTLGLIGCGAHAVTQLHAITRLFDLESVLIHDVDPAMCRTFPARASFLNGSSPKLVEAPLDLLVKSADIICTSTSVGVGQGPVFEDNDTKPWLHINAIGADFPGKTELPLSLLKRSFVCPDFLEQALKEGECQQLSPEEIGPSLVELVKNPKDYTFVRDITSVFDSTGWALEDQVAMELFIDYATDLGLGTPMQIESMADEPRDPYRFITG